MDGITSDARRLLMPLVVGVLAFAPVLLLGGHNSATSHSSDQGATRTLNFFRSGGAPSS
jgi:hypothetical protein